MKPGSPEWEQLITASKVAAILGVSPWESPRSVWHRMHGDVPREESNTVQKRGHYLEPAILAWWRDQHGVDAGPRGTNLWEEQPDYSLDDWAAATPDATCALGTVGQEDWTRVLVEAKSAADDREWGQPGTAEIPPYYLPQVFWQMHVSGVHRCYVPIITARLEFREYVVDYDPVIGAKLEARMRGFYDSLAADEPPPLDDTVATFNTMRKVHSDIEPGVEVVLSEVDAAALVEANVSAKEWDANLRYAKSVVLDQMATSQYATCNGVRIARRQPRGDDVTFVVTAKTTDFLNATGDAA